jgi:hypothetical protein
MGRRGGLAVTDRITPASAPGAPRPASAARFHPWPADKRGGSDPDLCPECGQATYRRALRLEAGGSWRRPAPSSLTCSRCGTTWAPAQIAGSPPMADPAQVDGAAGDVEDLVANLGGAALDPAAVEVVHVTEPAAAARTAGRTEACAGSAPEHRPYAPGGPDHSRPWAPPARERRTGSADAGFIVAGRPVGPTSGFGIQHLFRRPGEGCLCDEVGWLQVVRAELVSPLTWICARCQAIAAGELDPCVRQPEVLPSAEPQPDGAPAPGEERRRAAEKPDAEDLVAQVAAIRRGECPSCGRHLTDPQRSAGGWRHCRDCRRGWAVETLAGQARPTWQDWPSSAAAVHP